VWAADNGVGSNVRLLLGPPSAEAAAIDPVQVPMKDVLLKRLAGSLPAQNARELMPKSALAIAGLKLSPLRKEHVGTRPNLGAALGARLEL